MKMDAVTHARVRVGVLTFRNTCATKGILTKNERQELGFMTGFNDTPTPTPDCK